MNTVLKKVIAAFMAIVMSVGCFATTAFAAEVNAADISIETARKIAEEIINSEYDYSGLEQQERGALSTGVKTVLKFIKNNLPKVLNILKKYGGIVVEGKGVVQFIDDLLDGVIEVSDTIDAAIYAVVDFIAPDLNEDVKQIIANAIRLICPI